MLSKILMETDRQTENRKDVKEKRKEVICVERLKWVTKRKER
jgi:hypothetical protein